MKKILYLFMLLIISCSQKEYSETKDSDALLVNKNVVSVAMIEEAELSLPKRLYNPKILPYLKDYLNLLESGSINNYSWTDNTSCNCGLLSQIVGNMTVAQVDSSYKSYRDYILYSNRRLKEDSTYSVNSWTNLLTYKCGVTGKKVSGIIGELQDAGFNTLDISALEYLSDVQVLKNSGINTQATQYFYMQKGNLILYLKSWIKIIESQKSSINT